MTLPKPIGDPTGRRARALADATRRRLLEHLSREPLDVRELAARTGLHQNAVRQHLAVLHDAGLVVTERDRSTARVGRPRALYRAVSDAPTGANPFEQLAALLADVAGGRDLDTVGAEAGAALAALQPGADPAELLASLATGSGFTAAIDRRPRGTRIALGGCPFAAIAGPTVCGLHRAILDGAARAAGSAVVRFDVVDPAVHPCELTLAPTTGASR